MPLWVVYITERSKRFAVAALGPWSSSTGLYCLSSHVCFAVLVADVTCISSLMLGPSVTCINPACFEVQCAIKKFIKKMWNQENEVTEMFTKDHILLPVLSFFFFFF